MKGEDPELEKVELVVDHIRTRLKRLPKRPHDLPAYPKN
jgi:hypothetical protein